MRRWRAPWMVALVVYMVAAGVLLAPSIRPGRTVIPVDVLEVVEPFRTVPPDRQIHNPLPSDPSLQFLGWYSWFGSELRTGHIPQWNPDVVGGVAVEPNGNVSPYYPPYWFARWLDTFDAYNAYVWLHFVIAAIGAYAFARRLGARALVAGVAGGAVMSAALWVHLSTHLVHLGSMTWLGLVLAAVHALVTERRAGFVVAVAVTTAMSWLAAGTQFAYFLALAAGGYGAALALIGFPDRSWLARLRSLGGLTIGMVLGLALSAPLVLPGLSARDEILREGEPVTSMANTHLPDRDLLRILVPDWRGGTGETAWHPSASPEYDVDSPFVGAATVVLAAGSIALARRRDVAIAVAATGVVYALAFTGLPHRVLYAVVPGYDQFRVSARWVAILPGLVVPLAAVALSALLDGNGRVRRTVLGAAAAAGLVVGGLGLAAMLDAAAPQRYLAIRVGAAGVAVALIAAAAWRPRATAAVALVGAAVAGEAAFHTGRWYGSHREAGALPPLATVAAARERGGRIIRLTPELTQIPPLPADVPLAYDIADASGWNVIFPRDFDRYMRLVQDHGEFAKATNVAPPLTDPAVLASPLLDALDVRTVLVDPAVTAPLPYPEIARDGAVRAVARPSLGAAVLVPRADPTTSAGMWRHVAEPRWRPDRTAAVVGLRRPVRGGDGRVERVAHTADTERYQVDAPEGGLLRVSGRFDRGWSARIDGRDAPVYRADGIFRAVVVPPGRHRVTWRYRNPAEETGRKVALLTLLAMAVTLAVTRRPRAR